MPNTSDYCLTSALGRLFYAFVYGRMPFLNFPHFMDLKFIVLLKRTLFWLMLRSTPSCLCPESVWCSPQPHTYALSQSDAVHTLTHVLSQSDVAYTLTHVLSQSDAVHTHTLMSWVSLMQSNPTHFILSQSDSVHTHTLMSWASLMQSKSSRSVSWRCLCPLINTSSRLSFTLGFRTNNWRAFVIFICVLHVQFMSSSTY
jgi:hypothetical protein